MEDCTRLDIINAGNLEKKISTKKSIKPKKTKSDAWTSELKNSLSSNWTEKANGVNHTTSCDSTKLSVTLKKDTETNLYGYSISCNTIKEGVGFSSNDLTKTLEGVKTSIEQVIKSLTSASLSCTHEINLIKNKALSNESSQEIKTNNTLEEHISLDDISNPST